ncbi:GNAT family N-acetyltransferase [Desulfoluna spongiiphila]|uniref:Ribosomal-protein-serine acetyltransferase n=1 Tax=Desulfoluna spongiiphila TaxID=419481 RepID=A0A1G5FFM4_9BACT|nr:GNAT family N-acetyltransferase [Desulfoluna spongiiphila]SCY38013.1 ribosomal-protein-serine acetyltransferase [Desulfoluna spongiiphila]
MFYRQIDRHLQLRLSVPQFADELFQLTETNRDYLKTWLPWLDSIQKPEDTRRFLDLQLHRFSKGLALHETIFYEGRIAGVLGYNLLDHTNGIGQIGYWMGEEFTGKGIMTRAVKDLILLGFHYWDIQKVEIRCGVANSKSRAIPERLGFTNEGTLRRAEKFYDHYRDLVVYGLLQDETE